MPNAPSPKPKKNNCNSAGVFRASSIHETANHFRGPVILILIKESARPNNMPNIIERIATSNVNNADSNKSGRDLNTGLQWKL